MKPTLKARVTGTKLADDNESIVVTLDVNDGEGEVCGFTVTIPPEYKPPSAGDELELTLPLRKRKTP